MDNQILLTPNYQANCFPIFPVVSATLFLIIPFHRIDRLLMYYSSYTTDLHSSTCMKINLSNNSPKDSLTGKWALTKNCGVDPICWLSNTTPLLLFKHWKIPPTACSGHYMEEKTHLFKSSSLKNNKNEVWTIISTWILSPHPSPPKKKPMCIISMHFYLPEFLQDRLAPWALAGLSACRRTGLFLRWGWSVHLLYG